MEDLIYLSWGTSAGDVSLMAKVVVENEGRKLTAHSHTFGSAEKINELREEAVRGALATLRRQVEVLEALR